MSQWEYLTLAVDYDTIRLAGPDGITEKQWKDSGSLTDELNRLGAEEWELAGATGGELGALLIFKRRAEAPARVKLGQSSIYERK